MPTRFSFPPHPDQYYAQVWKMVASIPPGKVATYGQIAELVAVPEGMSFEDYRFVGARWVGAAMAACPEGVPWQRVLNAQGRISVPGEAGLRQRQLLEAEGVPFDGRDRVDLKRYRWPGPHPGGPQALELFPHEE